MRALGGARVVRHHEDRRAAIGGEQREQLEDRRRRAVRSRSPVGSSHSSISGSATIARAMADALFLSARELAREVVHAVLEADDAERGLDAFAALGLVERREEQRQLDVLRSAVSTGIRL